jgi:ubiquinone/menaquinone biosynthesis C-methylase UbiE
MTDELKQRVYWEKDHGFRRYDHPVVRRFALQRVQYIAKQLKLQQIENALDVGCGDGFSTYYMRQHISQIVGVDRSRQMLSRHPLAPASRVCLADALELPFPDNSFDLVYGWEVLHHIADPLRVVIEMTRVSRRYVLLAEPNRNNPAQFLFAVWDREHRWVLRYSLHYMRRLFTLAGLKVQHSDQGGWIFPNVTPIWLLPLLERIPYALPCAISNWVVGIKSSQEEKEHDRSSICS